jgi:nucleoside-diphosphate-sugar epimerase
MVSILGCGWLGLPLGKALAKHGEMVKGSTTSVQRFDELQEAGIKPYVFSADAEGISPYDDFFHCSTLIITLPPKLRTGETDSYLHKLRHIVKAIENATVKQVVFISSTGVYPDNNTTVDETVIPAPNSPSGKALWQAEELFRNHNHFKATIIRFGGLVGPGRHPGRFFAGKLDVPNGQAPVNLIHLQDCIGIICSVIKQQNYGLTINACSPHHPAKAVFYTQAAQHAGLQLPHFKDELISWKQVNSVVASSQLNYRYKVDDWQKCLTEACF